MMVKRSKDQCHHRQVALTILRLAVFLAVWLGQAALASSMTTDSTSFIAEAASWGDLATSQDESGWTNYILVVDNSGSTIYGLTSTGGVATDKDGLRFSACRLFSDVLPMSHNRMGIILFSGDTTQGSEATCTVLGPAELSDLPSMNAIKGNLSDKKIIGKRGNLTDIDFALNKALSMAKSFPNGDTRIVLITDGLNDLTNTSDALTNPVNLEANERTLSTISRIVDSGMKFYVVALTAGGDSPFRQQFMSFISDMGRVGGGEEDNGRLNNVFEAKASDLNQAILEISGAPASSPEVVPVTIDFDIPDIGIQEAGVTVSFATGDKSRLRNLSLVDPSDNTGNIPIWSKNGMPALDSSRFSVQEDINYINVRILKPTPGNWQLTVTGEQTDIYITTKLDQNTQIRLQGPVDAHVGEPVDFKLYYQTFEGGSYRDTKRQTLYDISTAQLTLTSPVGEVQQLPLAALDLCFSGSAVFDQAGEWHISAQAENSYHTRRIADIAFAVTEAPRIDPVTGVTLRIAPNNGVGSRGEIEIDNTTSEVQIAWSYQGEALSAVCDVIEDGMLRSDFREETANSLTIPVSELKQDVVYNVTLSIEAANGESVPPAQASFRILPPTDPVVIDSFAIAPQTTANGNGVYVYPSDQQQIDLAWVVSGDITQVDCSVVKEGMHAPEKPQSSGPNYISLNAATLDKGTVYTATLHVGAQDGDAKEETLQFTITPEPIPPVGFEVSCDNVYETKDGVVYTNGDKAVFSWSVPGEGLEGVQLEVTHNQGDPEIIEEMLDGDQPATQGKSEIKLKEKELCNVCVIPIPRYGNASHGEAYAQTITVTPRVLSPIEKLKAKLPMILGIAGGVIVLVALIVAIYMIKRPKLRGKLNLIVGNDTFPYTVDLKGHPDGTTLGTFKDIEERYKGQLFLKSLKSITLYMDSTDQYGSISLDSNPNPRYSLPNASALRIDTPDGQVHFAVSKDNTALFMVTDDNGQDVRCAITYAEVDQPGYPDLN